MELGAFLQLEPGIFKRVKRVIELSGVRIARHHFNLGFNLQGQVEPGTVLVGILAEPCDARWAGNPIGEASVAVSGGPVELSSAEGGTFFEIAVDVQGILRSSPAAVERVHALVTSRDRYVVRETVVAACLRAVLGDLFRDENAVVHPSVERHIHALAARALTGEIEPEATPNFARRVQAVRTCEAFIRENMGTDISLVQLSDVSKLRLRSLINAFQAVTGFSPMAYMKRLRLNEVRRVLRHARNGARIIDVAANWGFWHMGHFTTDYRSLFGELPSQTLLRAKNRAKGILRSAVRFGETFAADRNDRVAG